MAFTIPSIFTAVDRFSAPVAAMSKKLEAFASKAERTARMAGDVAKKVAVSTAIAGAAIAAPLVLAARDAIEFQDRMADVAKTTGMAGAVLDKYGGDLLALSGTTRTSIEDLVKISEIGGQLGIAQKDLLGFTGAVDKFNVALGKDFKGGVEEAATQVGNIKTLFAQTQQLNIADAITKTGSAINELGSVGAGTSANIAEFSLRMGQLPGALKPTLTDALALGTYLEEVGLSAEIGSGGLTRFLLVAGQDIGAFASTMKMTSVAAKQLLNTNPTEFAKQFALSVKDLNATDLATTLGKLGIGTQESIKVIGALGNGIDRVNDLQKVSNDAFQKGTSLQDEFNKKNETMAAKLQKAQNNMKALSIQVGTELLPILGEILGKIIPVIKGFSNWAKENPGLFKTIIYLTAGIAGFLATVSVVSSVVAGVMAVIAAFNALLLLSPIGWLTLGIIALGVAIVGMVAFWDKWGASLAVVLGPLGLLISLVQSLRRNWEMITKAFSEGGLLAGINAIRVAILDSILQPLQQVLGLLAKIPGMPFAETLGNLSAKVGDFRQSTGVAMTMDDGAESETKQAVNPEARRQDSIAAQMMSMNSNANVNLNVNDPTGRTTAESSDPFVKIKLGTTMPGY